MKVIIDIDENTYTRLFDNGIEDYTIVNDDLFLLANAIRKGEVLQEPKIDVLDKIREEVIAIMPPKGMWMYDEDHNNEQVICEVVVDVLNIIDKFKKRGK